LEGNLITIIGNESVLGGPGVWGTNGASKLYNLPSHNLLKICFKIYYFGTFQPLVGQHVDHLQVKADDATIYYGSNYQDKISTIIEGQKVGIDFNEFYLLHSNPTITLEFLG